MSKSQYQKTAEELLRNASLRATPIRTAILSHLLKKGCPVSHGDLWKRKRIRSFNRVTVYRTLLTLRQRGIVHAVQSTDGVWRYCTHAADQSGCPGNHPHFVCDRCKSMICLLGQTMPFVEVPEGGVVRAKQFVLYGSCPDCAGQDTGGQD